MRRMAAMMERAKAASLGMRGAISLTVRFGLGARAFLNLANIVAGFVTIRAVLAVVHGRNSRGDGLVKVGS